MKKTLLYITLLLFISTSAHAQSFFFRVPKFTQRMHIGYTYVANSAKYEGQVYNYNFDSASYTSLGLTSQNIRTVGGYGMVMGTYFPLTNFGGDKVGLALSTDFAYNFMLWEELKGGYYDQIDVDFFNSSGVTLQMGMPIGLDLKFGAESTTSKNHRLTATVGAGVNAMYSLTSYEDNVGAIFSPNPYIKLEGGIRAGIVMKLRILYTIGGPQYISEDADIFGSVNEYSTDFTLTGRSSLNISLLFSPFSWMWNEHGWWNKY